MDESFSVYFKSRQQIMVFNVGRRESEAITCHKIIQTYSQLSNARESYFYGLYVLLLQHSPSDENNSQCFPVRLKNKIHLNLVMLDEKWLECGYEEQFKVWISISSLTLPRPPLRLLNLVSPLLGARDAIQVAD
jgi:hypothetical protein